MALFDVLGVSSVRSMRRPTLWFADPVPQPPDRPVQLGAATIGALVAGCEWLNGRSLICSDSFSSSVES